jgi:hypothetical protein
MLLLTSPFILIAIILLIDKLASKNSSPTVEFEIEEDGWNYIR